MSEIQKQFMAVAFSVLDTDDGVTYQTYERLWLLSRLLDIPVAVWNGQVRDRTDMTDGRIYLKTKEAGYALQDM